MRVLVCMSGGVDSSVAAALLRREGHEVAGLFLRGAGGAPGDSSGSLREPDPGVADGRGPPRRLPRGCCSAEDAADAARVADLLGIPFYAADFSEDFEGLVEGFVAEYLRGRTPNPCVLCNRDLKFGRALEYARALSCDRVATGHYAASGDRGGRAGLQAAADAAKDQSYVLFPLSQEALRTAVFPLGGLRKEVVRAVARDLGLPTAEKPESMDLCFVPGGDYRALVRERAGDAVRPGIFADREGRVLGSHGGAALFTVGQRRGLGVGGRGRPLFVTGIDAGTGTVVLGEPADLDARSVVAGGWNPVSAPAPEPGGRPLPGFAKVRRGHVPQAVSAEGLGGGRVRLRFEDPVRAPTPGQAAVLYDGEGWVLGGGWIESAERAGCG